LKPVHRRILYACQEAGYVAGRPYRKSSRIVGDVMGKYHPHGDSAIYDALARMTQDWSMRVPLIDGQGNFGSMDPDPPAAMRYTEARLAKVANFLLGDIDKDTVDFTPNYDASEREPQVLPARFPNLLVNGAGGIAVGMATNIPPHNLGEVLAACHAFIADPTISSEGLMEYIKGPDFPTAPIILGTAGIRSAYTTGRGSILMRSRAHVEEGRGDRRLIVLTAIPYQVGKNGLVEKIAEAAKDKRIEGVSDIRDESNRLGVRIVIELKRDATPEVVLEPIVAPHPGPIFLPGEHACDPRRPPRNVDAARDHRSVHQVSRRSHHAPLQVRTVQGARAGAHLARPGGRGHQPRRGRQDHPRLGKPAEAREKLLSRDWPIEEIRQYIMLVEAIEPQAAGTKYRLSETQVRAILELRLHRLTQLGREEIGGELAILAKTIGELLEILGNRLRLYEVMSEELRAVEAEFATPRISEIAAAFDGLDDEDLIEQEDMVVTVTLSGYIKRTPLALFRNRSAAARAVRA
jgi:DNA gyrase subunit A